MKIDVVKVAKLANLSVTDQEIKRLKDQLSETLKFIDRLDEIDTSKMESTHSITGLENVTRDDETEPALSQEDALKNAQNRENGYFKVKAVFENES